MTSTPVIDEEASPVAERKPKPALAVTLPNAFKHGDVFTKGSALIMGLGNIVRKQYLKGLLFLAVQAIFIFTLVRYGISQLAGLSELGPVTEGTQGWNENNEFVNFPPTNSVEVLLYGVAWIFIIGAFIVAWAAAIKSAFAAQMLQARKGETPDLVSDVRGLLDGRIHVSLMSLPLMGIIVFTVVPLAFMILLAFTNFDRNNTPAFNWVGFETIATVFSPEKGNSGVNLTVFLRVLAWTLTWAVFATFLNFFFGMFMAMIILRNGTRFKSMWRAVFSLSIAVPQFVSLLVISQMLQDQGIVNQLLKSWGWIETSMPFFTDAWWARATVIVVNLWIGIPYTIMQVTGILQNIPGELYEAAEIDGANWWQAYTRITLPYIFFVMTPYLITTFTGNINNFNVIFLLSNGAPFTVGESAGHTDLLITWLYKLTVDRGDYNIGAVIGIATFIVLATVSLITYRSSASYKNEEGFR
ncbi:MAG: sugar ABC transporter permease [Propionibacteriaceae bacterium]|nr:sugar ABC transporter permease [Propionibacteriaceae bacterium]